MAIYLDFFGLYASLPVPTRRHVHREQLANYLEFCRKASWFARNQDTLPVNHFSRNPRVSDAVEPYFPRCQSWKWQSILIFSACMHLCRCPLDAMFIRNNWQTILNSYRKVADYRHDSRSLCIFATTSLRRVYRPQVAEYPQVLQKACIRRFILNSHAAPQDSTATGR